MIPELVITISGIRIQFKVDASRAVESMQTPPFSIWLSIGLQIL